MIYWSRESKMETIGGPRERKAQTVIGKLMEAQCEQYERLKYRGTQALVSPHLCEFYLRQHS
jgi:hypothetical protein